MLLLSAEDLRLFFFTVFLAEVFLLGISFVLGAENQCRLG